jgi:hypothetical protein
MKLHEIGHAIAVAFHVIAWICEWLLNEFWDSVPSTNNNEGGLG